MNRIWEEVNRIWEEECSRLQLEIMHVMRFIFDFARSDRFEVGVHSTHVACLYIWNCVVLGHIYTSPFSVEIEPIHMAVYYAVGTCIFLH